MNGKIRNGIAGIVISGIAIMAAGCSSGTSLDEAPISGDSTVVIEDVTGTDGMPSLAKVSSDWQQWSGDLVLKWLDKHQSVGYGLNELDETIIYAKSDGVYNFENGGKDYINFPSTNNFSYAVFGLKDIPVGAIIRGIHFTTDFNSSESPVAEYYVSFSNYETGNFQWYGPYHEGDIELYNLFTNTVNVGQKAYFTIALMDNLHWSDVTDVEVVIGDPVVIDLPILYERNPIPNWWLLDEDGFVDWDRFFELPAVQDLKIMPQMRFQVR